MTYSCRGASDELQVGLLGWQREGAQGGGVGAVEEEASLQEHATETAAPVHRDCTTPQDIH